MQGHLPATLPHHQFAVIGSAVGLKGKGAGHGEKAKRQKTNRSPQALLREAFIVGGPCDTRGSSKKHTSLKSRDHGVSHTGICWVLKRTVTGVGVGENVNWCSH